jgi:hypothetical protein
MSDALPALPDECWPVDTTVCTGWDDLSAQIQDTATAYAGQALRLLTGFRVGGCSITVRPCSRPCVEASAGWYGFGVGFRPYINGLGEWVNSCGCITSCNHLGAASITLPGTVGQVDEVLIDGVAVDPADYRVDNGNQLVRVDGQFWPTTQDMLLAPTEVGTFAITYLNGIPVDGLGARAAGVLACEFAQAIQGLNCALPPTVTSIARQGVSMTLEAGVFPGGVTGIREVDMYIERWNPGHLRSATRVWSPDLVNPRVTTWG